MKTYHNPVLLNESISYLNLRDNGIYVDGTLGGGGHSKAILQANESLLLFAFDRDIEAIEYNRGLAEQYRKRLKIFNDNFVNMRTRLALERITKVSGIILDLGVSFSQISTSERGMSFNLDGRLDMRMNQKDELTAYDVVNKYPIEDLAQIFKEYGEEREALRIARGLEYHRKRR